MKSINLSYLNESVSGIQGSFGQYMSDCASYCLMSEGHDSGVLLSVKTDEGTTTYQILWDVILDETLKKSMKDEERATEFGAMGIAVLLTLELTKYTCFEVAGKGTGIDFWLFEEDDNDLEFESRGARLEVSGIKKASKTNTISNRIKIKKKQSEKSKATGKIVYIAVCEFSKPESVYISK